MRCHYIVHFNISLLWTAQAFFLGHERLSLHGHLVRGELFIKYMINSVVNQMRFYTKFIQIPLGTKDRNRDRKLANKMRMD